MSEAESPTGGPTRTLATGAKIPQLGLGVWQVTDGIGCERTVRWALERGFRLIDTAQAYGNEASVGRAIRDSGIPREQIFVTTKFFPGHDDPRKEAQESLERLDIGYIDLYLVHWPQGGATWAWPGMEGAVTSGIVRSIGVSNFNPTEIDALMEAWTVPPVVNQIQVSPFEYRRGLIEKSESEGLVVQAYSPLGTGRHLKDAAVMDLAARLHQTPAQVLIRWGLQKGLSVITKASQQPHIDDNFDVLGFELDTNAVETLDGLDSTHHTDAPLASGSKWWS